MFARKRTALQAKNKVIPRLYYPSNKFRVQNLEFRKDFCILHSEFCIDVGGMYC